jgi:uncharacterized iron-regulated membrane protein
MRSPDLATTAEPLSLPGSAGRRRSVAAGVLGAVRRVATLTVLRSHLWFGLVTAIAVIVVSVTGILLNHRERLGLWDRPVHESAGRIEDAKSLRELLVLGITAAHAEGVVARDIFGNQVDTTRQVARMMYRPGRNQASIRIAEPRHTEAVIDATSGEVLDVAPRDDVRLEHIHSGEVIGQRGVIVSDIAAVVLIVLTLGGVYLWLNRLWRKWRRPADAPRKVHWATRVNRHVHLWGGLIMAVAVITISVTGIMLNHKREWGFMLEPYRQFEYEPGRFPELSLLEITTIAKAAAFPDAPGGPADMVQFIDYRPPLGYGKVRFDDETEVIVDVHDGEVISVAERQDVWISQLHSGLVFGDRWDILSDITAGVLIVLTLNGLFLWVWPVWSSRSRQARSGPPKTPAEGAGP